MFSILTSFLILSFPTQLFHIKCGHDVGVLVYRVSQCITKIENIRTQPLKWSDILKTKATFLQSLFCNQSGQANMKCSKTLYWYLKLWIQELTPYIIDFICSLLQPFPLHTCNRDNTNWHPKYASQVCMYALLTVNTLTKSYKQFFCEKPEQGKNIMIWKLQIKLCEQIRKST